MRALESHAPRRSESPFISAFPFLKFLTGNTFHSEPKQRTLERSLSKPQFKLWDSEAYVTRSRTDRYTRTDVKAALEQDLVSFFHEYAGGFAVKKYDYGVHGINDAYKETISASTWRHLLSLKQKGKSIDRSMLEHDCTVWLEQWLVDPNVKPGESIIWISPTGLENEEYPGKERKNYSFINVYTKQNDGANIFTQYLSYDNDYRLAELQTNLMQENGATVVANKLTKQPKQNRLDHQIIANMLKVPHLDQELFQQQIRKHEQTDNWYVKWDELPTFDGIHYQKQVDSVVTLCLEVADQLLNSDPKHFAIKYDTLVKNSREAILMWIEDHAANCSVDPKTQQARKALQELYGITQPPYNLPKQFILDFWKISLKTELPSEEAKLTESESKLFSLFQISTEVAETSAFGKFLSGMHCVVGSPTSLMSNPNMNINMMMAIESGSLTFDDLKLLIGDERAKNWKPGTCEIFDPETKQWIAGCGKETLIGECGLCYHCEINWDDKTSLQKLKSNTLKDVLLSKVTSEFDVFRANKLYDKFIAKVFPSSWDFETAMGSKSMSLNAVSSNEKLEKIIQRLTSSSNVITTLQEMLAELDEPSVEELDTALEKKPKEVVIFSRSRLAA